MTKSVDDDSGWTKNNIGQHVSWGLMIWLYGCNGSIVERFWSDSVAKNRDINHLLYFTLILHHHLFMVLHKLSYSIRLIQSVSQSINRRICNYCNHMLWCLLCCGYVQVNLSKCSWQTRCCSSRRCGIQSSSHFSSMVSASRAVVGEARVAPSPYAAREFSLSLTAVILAVSFQKFCSPALLDPGSSAFRPFILATYFLNMLTNDGW